MNNDVIGGDLLGSDVAQTIAHAMNARVEAEVMKALAGDEMIGRLVTAALMEPVQTDRYDRRAKTPYLHVKLNEAIKGATKIALQKVVEEETPLIEEEIRKALRRNIKTMAEQLTERLGDQLKNGYGINVTLRTPND
jgi:hypothetical protein